MEPQRSNGAQGTIGVIFPGALGDFLCFLPALQTLSQRSAVDLFARSEFAELTPQNVEVLSLEHAEISKLFRPESNKKSAAQGFFRRYDAVYSWFASANPEFVLRLDTITEGRARVFPFRPDYAVGHQADYYINCLHHGTAPAPLPAIEVRPQDLSWCDAYWEQRSLQGRAVLAIAPGSGAREKNWPSAYFLAVSRWWREATGGAVLLLVGPVEAERGGLESLRVDCITASDLPLSRVAALLSRSTVYLGNDSGISHLAAACGVRTVVLFGPSDDRQWAPRGKKVVIVRRNSDCSPCADPTKNNDLHHTCLSALHPAEIGSILAHLPEVVTLTRCGAGITV